MAFGRSKYGVGGSLDLCPLMAEIQNIPICRASIDHQATCKNANFTRTP